MEEISMSENRPPRFEVIAPNVSQMLNNRLDELNVNLHELANRINSAYDHIRLIVKGYKFPGKLMLREIATNLGMDEAALMAAYELDKSKRPIRVPVDEELRGQLMALANLMIDVFLSKRQAKPPEGY
jgi:hypothetical protein